MSMHFLHKLVRNVICIYLYLMIHALCLYSCTVLCDCCSSGKPDVAIYLHVSCVRGSGYKTSCNQVVFTLWYNTTTTLLVPRFSAHAVCKVNMYCGRQRSGNKAKLANQQSKTGGRESSGMHRNETSNTQILLGQGQLNVSILASISFFRFKFPFYFCFLLSICPCTLKKQDPTLPENHSS